MLAHAASTTAVLFCVALATKLLTEPQAGGVGGGELVRQSLHWRDVAAQDADTRLKLQHATYAAALLHAARTVSSDILLEQAVGIDIPRLARKLETKVAEARDAIKA